ncbi:hypothetical protein [Streptomyces sp. CC224B]|uniref:hypothetical protein n=1 Tax=Streptomyces sp. CC224B TaxID=3044571 RepID=UPI0024A7FDEA|nr:hypothetical protein [Streptomyces sp. CC224B]
MSYNRDNVTWQSANGTWNIGFWRFEYTGDGTDEDFDAEWDVEYSHDGFWFLSTGHATPEAAMDAYCQEEPNPGMTLLIPQDDPQAADDIARYEALAADFKAKHGSSAYCLNA